VFIVTLLVNTLRGQGRRGRGLFATVGNRCARRRTLPEAFGHTALKSYHAGSGQASD
jgi:hypothetical protein